MDDSQTALYPATYGFDIDMMKRPLEAVGGPDAKKARWSPSLTSATSANGATAPNDAFANYGYGPQATINQSPFLGTPQQQNQPFPSSPLYATPQLTVNTAQTNGVAGGQLSPNTAVAFAQQQGQGQGSQLSPNTNGYGNFAAYNMLGMGMPGMSMLNGFAAYNGQMGNFGQQQQRMPSLGLNIPAAQAAYSNPAALSAVLNASASQPTNRTVYIGNLPATASVDELLNLVHFGPLESIRVLPEKSCVFLSFLDGNTAAAFHADATVKKMSLHGQELKIGWGKPSPVPAQVQLAIAQSNASRNVYLGGLDETMTEEQLRDDLSRFGLIDQVKIVRDKNIGFVHFLSIAVANKVVNTLPTEPNWAGKRVNYGKDRCAYIPKSQQAAAHQAQAAAAQSLIAQSAAVAGLSPQAAVFSPFAYGANPFGGPGANGADMSGMGGMPGVNGMNGAMVNGAAGNAAMNRTVYLGNIHPETTTEDLCNTIRGGVLQSIRYMQDKHIAFVTFVDPAAAFTFFQVASYQGLTLNNRRLKTGWGKNSGPLPTSLALAVHSGATRNVYVGNIEDFETFTDERLKRDFGEYGDIELVNFLKEKNCAFVNFTNISNAIKAIDGIKTKPEYTNLRIAHGKDRCANPPRSGPQGGSGPRRTASGHTNADASPGTLGAVSPSVGQSEVIDDVGAEFGVEGEGEDGQGHGHDEMRVDAEVTA